MKLLSFELSMPGVASWNGKWTGEGRPYILVRRVKDTTAERLVPDGRSGYFSYGWEDGWRAGVTVRIIDGDESRKLRRKSVGFAGYDWMVQSLIDRGVILAKHEVARLEEE